MIFYIFLTAFLRTIGSFIDKTLTQKGISRFDYFFYMCLSMLPFSLLMMAFEPFRLELHPFPVLLLLAAAVLRYLQQHAVVGITRKSEPYQYQTYLTMAIALTYIIDCFLGTRAFNLPNILSVILVLGGVLLVGKIKLEFNQLNRDILIRVLCGILQGYITFYILKYWSNAFYIFSLNFILTATFLKKYSQESHTGHRVIIAWVFLQQTFGFSCLFLSNYLTASSVTLGIYIYPVAIMMSFIFSFFKNYSGTKTGKKEIAAIFMVITGVLLLSK